MGNKNQKESTDYLQNREATMKALSDHFASDEGAQRLWEGLWETAQTMARQRGTDLEIPAYPGNPHNTPQE